MDQYSDSRKYIAFYVREVTNALWKSGGMTKEIHESLNNVLVWDEKTHLEVLEIYGAYTDTLKALKEN